MIEVDGKQVFTELHEQGCVEASARDAMFNDDCVVIPEDCVASDDRGLHDASLLLMRHRADVTTSGDSLRAWVSAAGGP
jgi:hypothetical protein